MKNILELLKKIVGISNEQPIVQDMSDELKKVRSNMLAMQIFSVIFMFVMLIFTVVFFVDCVTDLYEYTVKPSLGLAKALCIVIPNFILCLSLFVISLLCKNIFMNVNKNGTPFIPQVPKEMKKIAAVIAAMLILSATAEFLFPIVFPVLGTESEFVTNPAGWAFLSLLLMLSSIFDYGCRLQQESYETL